MYDYQDRITGELISDGSSLQTIDYDLLMLETRLAIITAPQLLLLLRLWQVGPSFRPSCEAGPR